MATITQFVSVTTTKTVSAATSTMTNRATEQGGVLTGSNPSVYSPSQPIILFIIQAGIVIIFCRLLHWPLSKMRQPRVIAEVLGGILLGPSVMGRIPGFTAAIFPTAAMPNFSLVANLGLVLYLFLVGLEVDLRFLTSNWRAAISVGALGMALPFGFGCAVAYGLYNTFREDSGLKYIPFPVYMLFIAIAMAITAFPVLCRILSELKLLSTPVGIIVLAAGVGNDVVGWILLALCVALVNAGTGITALWVLLTAFGFSLFLAFAVRPALLFILVRTRSLENGPSQGIVCLVLMTALASAFFTGIIGIHPIFGAFMVGLICPHEGGFAVKLTEKIEDIVSALFLPLYFALSGLSTNLGLLNNGITWAYVVGVTSIAFFAKVGGGCLAARLNGMVWRESFAIGSLMSCKGLVELIVLNIGLQANILSQRTFTIFVVMALVTTFATTPLVSYLYPPWYQKKIEAWKRGEIDWDSGRPYGEDGNIMTDDDTVALEKAQADQISRMLVYLRIDGMPGLLALTTLFGGANDSLREAQTLTPITAAGASDAGSARRADRPIDVHAVRLLQLTERESSVMRVSEMDGYSDIDPLVNTFRSLGRLHSVAVSGEVAVVPESYYADTIVSRAADMSSDLVLLPWSQSGSLSEFHASTSTSVDAKLEGGPFADFVLDVLDAAACHVAVFVDAGLGTTTHYQPDGRRSSLSSRVPAFNRDHSGHHVFLPFFGSADDRVAARFVLQLLRDRRVTATIVHYRLPSAAGAAGAGPEAPLRPATPTTAPPSPTAAAFGLGSGAGAGAGKSRPTVTSSSRRGSLSLMERSEGFLGVMRAALPAEASSRLRVHSVDCEAEDVAEYVLTHAGSELNGTPSNAGNLMVLGRNGGEDARGAGSLGRLGDAAARRITTSSMMVFQARRK